MHKKSSLAYFIQGWSMLSMPGIKRFVLLPMLANIIVMSLLFYWLFKEAYAIVEYGLSFLPTWLQWMGYIIGLVMTVGLAIFFGYFFSTITNIIAAPFNGLLAEQVEAKLTGFEAPKSSAKELLKDLPRVMKRELQKLLYYIRWAIPLFLTYFIPIFGQIVTPIAWFIFTAWMISIQYNDYPFDNHKISFTKMRRLLKQNRGDNIAFGSLITLFTLIPLLNLIIMPVAVCAATAMWVDHYSKLAYRDDCQH